FHSEVEVIPAVGREGLSEEYKVEVEVKDRENQTLSNDDNPPIMSLRPLTPLPTNSAPDPHNSALLGICLDTALTNEGLATLHAEGLVQVQTLCWMITIMMMNLTTILEENAEELIHNSSEDADFLFVGADPQKVRRFKRLLLVDEQTATSWQPTQDVLATPVLQSVDEMLNTSYDYDMELYRDGES
ncbi:hypothetical protein Moror_7926, partial [Moniliophthora roreri MCA 2997]